jgi:hypothetical protein
MEKLEIEELISKRITEAKLDVAEKRLQFVLRFGGALLVILGVLLPIVMTERSSFRMDKAIDGMNNSIQEMKKDYQNYMQMAAEQNKIAIERMDKEIEGIRSDFKDLSRDQKEVLDQSVVKLDLSVAKTEKTIDDLTKNFAASRGIQLRKPDIICYCDKISLDKTTITVTPGVYGKILELRNIGDAVAENIRVKVYTNTEYLLYGDWQNLSVSDEADYKFAYNHYNIIQSIDAKNSEYIQMTFNNEIHGEYPMLLKIFYAQSDPKIITFNVEIK